MSNPPAEREMLPGVFLTDFRRANAPPQTPAAHGQEEKEEGQASEDSPAAASATSSTAHLARDVPSAFPRDIPDDVETLELELEAIGKNLAQLIKSNLILQEELAETPDDQDFADAIRENRVVILRRSDRMTQIRAQLQLIAPHRVEAVDAQLAAAIAVQQAAAARDLAPAIEQPAEEEEGLFL